MLGFLRTQFIILINIPTLILFSSVITFPIQKVSQGVKSIMILSRSSIIFYVNNVCKYR